jgi:hypothetical protein
MKNSIRGTLCRLAQGGLFLLACLAVVSLPALGQTFYGSIVGTVTDTSGAIVPEATVTLTSLGTDEHRTAPTDANGSYQFVNLVPGRYAVDIEKNGFKHFKREPVVVDVESAVRIDAQLQVGNVTQVVEVTVQTPLLQTESASLGTVVEQQTVQELPLNGRNVLNLTALVAGVVPQGQALENPTGTNIFAWGNYQIGGGMANISASYVDGGTLNVSHANITALVPTQDAIQEFRVQTNNLGPEFSHFAGGVINLTTKSGTNTFHGGAYEFLRNKSLNARNAFSPNVGAYVQNQFGANIGGPIIKDNTFFFFSYEGFRQRYGETFTDYVPTPSERGGDFSALLPAGSTVATCSGATPAPGCIFDPGQFNSSGQFIANSPRIPFQCDGQVNIICSGRFDPVAKMMTNLWAMPNANLPYGDFTTDTSVGGDNDQINARIDRTAGEKQRIFGRYTYWTNLNLGIDPYGTKVYVDRGPENFHTQQIVLGDTYMFSPTTVGDFRIAFLRFVYNRVPGSQGFDLSQYGAGWSSLNSQVQYRNQPIPVVEGFSDYFATTGAGSTIFERNDDYTITPSLTKTVGGHTLKFGADLRRLTDNYTQTQQPSGVFDFDHYFTSVNPLAAAGTGFGFASFLLGYGDGGGTTTSVMTAGTQYYLGYYAADKFQVTRKLTFDYGLRWDMPTGFSERYDRQTVFIPTATNLLAAPTGLPLKGALALVNSPAYPSRYNQDFYWHLFAPRVGIAYRLTNRTVVRSGYGIFYLPNDIASPYLSPINLSTTPFLGTLDGSFTPFATLSSPFPTGLLQPLGRSPSFQNSVQGLGFTDPLPHTDIAYVGQWNLDLERELGQGTLLEIAYAGSKGTHLPALYQQLNQLPDQDWSQGFGLFAQVKNPFYGLITSGALAAPTVFAGQLELPYSQFGSMASEPTYNRDSLYNSLQVTFRKQFHSSGTILAAYTYSKTIANTDTISGWLESSLPGNFYGLAQDSYNLRAERSLASFDVPQRLVLSYVLDLPFGKGKKFLSGVKGASDKAVSGWGINGITTFQSGFPISLFTGGNYMALFNAGENRPNVVDGCNVKLPGSAQSRLLEWFNTACFTYPGLLSYGDMAPSIGNLRADGINNWDFAVFKNTRITERMGLQFRAEFFNLYNRTQFGPPGQVLLIPTTFGVSNSQVNNPRLIQFALRLVY